MKSELQDLINDCTAEINDIESRISTLPAFDKAVRYLTQYALIDASNSLVTNRHNFAHGKMPTATFNDIKLYYFDVLELIKIFDSIVC